MINPFATKTPEALTHKDIATLFVDVYSDFPRLLSGEHTFLHGARGTGKSMMLRYMEPNVQLAAEKYDHPSKIPHFAVHMPIKSPTYAVVELERLEGVAYDYMAEHFLVCNALIQIFEALNDLVSNFKFDSGTDDSLLVECFDLLASRNFDVVEGGVSVILEYLLEALSGAKTYLKKLAFTAVPRDYEGDLYTYSETLMPVIRKIRELSVAPLGPIFLMIDDADNLPVKIQRIINTWVSYRSTQDLCLKISTQQRYRTWRTVTGALIERAHDFSEIDISAVYTSKNNSHYFDRVEQIVKRRLEIAGFSCVDPYIFFPEDTQQVDALCEVKGEIEGRWEKGFGRGGRKHDDVNRYLVSEYMRRLASAKKTNQYSYAGFKSLVNVSSGMVRFFLEPAARMISEMIASGCEEDLKFIPAPIQDGVVKKWSEEYVIDEFRRMLDDERSDERSANCAEKLRNLVNGLGMLFQSKLLSTDSERRLLSFMITAEPSKELESVLRLGIEWGYFSAKSISRKEGIGRNSLYVLNRRLAPYFKLDPSGYAAHMSMTPEMLLVALEDPKRFVRLRLNMDSAADGAVEQGALDI